MRILVTGGMGFVGSHLADELVKKGHSVRVYDNLDEQVHQGNEPRYLNPQVEYIRGDVRDRESFKNAIEGCEIIFHEAATVGVGQSMYKVAYYIDTNDTGTANLWDILINEKNRVKKVLVASSMSIYGEGIYHCVKCGEFYPALRNDADLARRDWQMHCPKCSGIASPKATHENKTLYPTSVYAYSKKHQEELSMLLARTYKIPTVALRYFNIYGPRQALSNPYTGVCAIFSARIKNNNPPIIYEDGRQTRDFIYVSDIVDANLLAMEEAQADYKVLNVGTGIGTSILDVAEVLIKLQGAGIDTDVVNKYRSGDIRHCFADISEIQKLGFRPKVGFSEGMKLLYEWSRTQEAQDKVEAANRELESRGLTAK